MNHIKLQIASAERWLLNVSNVRLFGKEIDIGLLRRVPDLIEDQQLHHIQYVEFRDQRRIDDLTDLTHHLISGLKLYENI